MKLAIIETSGTQYKVSEGDTIRVDHIQLTDTKDIEYNNVLLYADDKNIAIGKPYLKNCTVAGTIERQYKGEKIRVATYKAKSRHRRVKGYRHQFADVKIGKITYVQKSK